MSIKIEADTSDVTDALAHIQQEIAKLPDTFAEELTSWQREDMHRKWPNTERPDAMTAETDIWPHSRLELAGLYKHSTGRPIGRPPGSGTVRRGHQAQHAAGGRVHSTRPILRPELWDRLMDRFDKLLQDWAI
jgi:hypothetical protein